MFSFLKGYRNYIITTISIIICVVASTSVGLALYRTEWSLSNLAIFTEQASAIGLSVGSLITTVLNIYSMVKPHPRRWESEE